VFLTVILLAYGLAQAQTPAAQSALAQSVPGVAGPTEVVQDAAQGMLTELDKDRDAYRRDPAKVGKLVDKYLMPHFDTEFSARLVLGQHWRTATPEQRAHFVEAFYHSLLANYGGALAEFTANRLQILPTRIDPDATYATVRTRVKRSSGDPVSVNYRLRRTPQGWKAYDVHIEGVSYVDSYREDFGSQIEKQGIDAVIKRLEAGLKPDAIAKKTGGSGG
jgi:phospholipid transport system substrate-binding protein